MSGMTRAYYARCNCCGWREEADSFRDASERSDEHDRQEHRSRPTSAFGYRILSPQEPQ